MKPKGNYSRGEESKVCPSCIHIWRQNLCNICAGKNDSKTDNRRWSYYQSRHINRRLAKGLFYLFLWHVCMIYFVISDMQLMLVIFLPNQEDHPAWWILLVSQPVYLSLSDHTTNSIFTNLQHYKRINYSIIFQQSICCFSCILLKSYFLLNCTDHAIMYWIYVLATLENILILAHNHFQIMLRSMCEKGRSCDFYLVLILYL